MSEKPQTHEVAFIWKMQQEATSSVIYRCSTASSFMEMSGDAISKGYAGLYSLVRRSTRLLRFHNLQLRMR